MLHELFVTYCTNNTSIMNPLCQKHLQYVVIIINTNIIVVIIGVTIIESNLTSVDDQRVGRNDLSLVKVLFILNTYMCFISGILLARLL